MIARRRSNLNRIGCSFRDCFALRWPVGQDRRARNDTGRKARNNSGQAALILILLAAAALIFLAIVLNWGRVAQTKVLLSVAADQGASLLASDPASYGEMEKQTYLKDKNKLTESTGGFLGIFMVILVVVVAVVSIATGQVELLSFVGALLGASVVMSIANLVLQAAVVQPGLTSLWNKLQKDQPTQQQFFESAMAGALQSSVTDRVKIADYFDWNANGYYGLTGNTPNDTVSRLALFYTERLKMLNHGIQAVSPQVKFFHDQLDEFINGETCYQNESDYQNYPSAVTLNSYCLGINSSPTYCIDNPSASACETKIPFPYGFQLHDPCTGSDPSNTATYSPYCDPCCQPNSSCASNCSINNPYGSSYPYLYDSAFQNYPAKVSFLAKFGRDQQMGPFTSLTPQGSSANGIYFPRGIFPFFWRTKDYSLEVDNLDSTNLQSSQLHWCTSGVAPGYSPPSAPNYTDLTQLQLSYSCSSGNHCCTGWLAGSVDSNGVPSADGGEAIDMVGSPDFPYQTDPSSLYNPGLDPSFGAGGSAGTWLEGDNQMCVAAFPYNGASATGPPDGTCEFGYLPNDVPDPVTSFGTDTPATADSLDDVMHTLTDFVVFANNFFSKNEGTLSSTFSTWYPQAADWVGYNNPCDDNSTCSGGQCADGSSCQGRLLNIYNPYTGLDKLSTWNTVINNWLNVNYTPSSTPYPWCVPPEDALLTAANGSTQEDSAINASGATWGTLSCVIACLNYNANADIIGPDLVNGYPSPAYNYQQCLTALGSATPVTVSCPGTSCAPSCPSPPQCAPSALGRSLAGAAPAQTSSSSTTSTSWADKNGKSCISGSKGCIGTSTTTTTCGINPAYTQWVQNSLTLAVGEAPKFALRSAYLTDIQSRAQVMQNILPAASTALQNFLKPCAASDTSCQSGGPAAQLAYAGSTPSASPLDKFPNSVIYGWVDANPAGGGGGCTDPATRNLVGCAHIVKVTAYAPGRNHSNHIANSLLPWIKTKTKRFLGIPISRSYTLTDRDGLVYVSIRRWDEDQGKVLFPNQHALWQFLFHNPRTGKTTTGQGLPRACQGLSANAGVLGFGLLDSTVDGLNYKNQLSSTDQQSLSEAFMLNDEINGTADIDPEAQANSGYYNRCLQEANTFLSYGTESHTCVQYIASRNASGSSGDSDQDYSLKFVNCPSIPPDDLQG